MRTSASPDQKSKNTNEDDYQTAEVPEATSRPQEQQVRQQQAGPTVDVAIEWIADPSPLLHVVRT